jgi:hypothetical protein
MPSLVSVIFIKSISITWDTLFQNMVEQYTQRILKPLEDGQHPICFSEFISFMGLASYYIRFIAGFSKISHPITSLQKKGIKFEWSSKCEQNFNLLKEFLTSAPVLNIFDPNESFVVCKDACKEGLHGVLTQNGHVNCYESINIK